ncbi:MAG: hypothetical protein F6K17_04300 [Okeania sp. SIO3C4]|nr:hypothetical protein [Okeania sp. SIO3C4]
MTDSQNYLLEQLKIYINDNLQLPQKLSSNLIPTLDKTLLELVDKFLENTFSA